MVLANQRTPPQHCIFPHASVPQQDNGYDCGVFVCRYAYALYLKRNQRFTESDVGREGSYFHNIVTRSPEFTFDMPDIRRLRADIKTLLNALEREFLRRRERKRGNVSNGGERKRLKH